MNANKQTATAFGDPVSRNAGKLGVVIPSYKSAHVIERALASIHGDSNVSEVIVVEDGKLDDLKPSLQKYSEKICHLENVTRKGAAAARNRGLAACSSEFVFFLDADDWVEGEFVENACAVLEKWEHLDFVLSPWRVETGSGSSDKCVPAIHTHAEWIAAYLTSGWVPPCGVVWRRKSVERIGAWREDAAHLDDTQLMIKAFSKKMNYAVASDGCGVYLAGTSPDRVSMQGRLSDLGFQQVYEQSGAIIRCFDSNDRDIIQDARAKFCYSAAVTAYTHLGSELGDLWLARARQLGFKGHLGRRPMRLLAAIVGLRRRLLVANFLRSAVMGVSSR